MRAAWYDRNGPAREVLKVGDLPDPTPGTGELRVRIAASGLNPSDVKRREAPADSVLSRARFRIATAPVSSTLSALASPSAGSASAWLWNAQWQRPYGTCAEYCCVPEALVAPLPDSIEFGAGACLGIPAMTAHQAVFSSGDVVGQTILVTGGAGAVGHYAIQIAKWGGARVIATVSSDTKGAIARNAGADHIVDYKREDVARRVLELTDGAGVDRVVEVDFGANVSTNLTAVKPNGVIAAYASMRAPEPTLPFYTMMRRGLEIDLVFVYLMKPVERARALADLGTLLAARRLRHQIGARFPLADTTAAHEAQESGRVVGNIVIDVAKIV